MWFVYEEVVARYADLKQERADLEDSIMRICGHISRCARREAQAKVERNATVVGYCQKLDADWRERLVELYEKVEKVEDKMRSLRNRYPRLHDKMEKSKLSGLMPR
jgi:DNA repair exonuclease SbcCD ATPase subunit